MCFFAEVTKTLDKTSTWSGTDKTKTIFNDVQIILFHSFFFLFLFIQPFYFFIFKVFGKV